MNSFFKRGLGTMALALLVSAAPAQAQVKAELPGPIDSLSDLQDAGKMAFKMADENNDGQISQKEAIDAGNLLVGGFFFRADANGDGVLSPEEAKQARDSFLNQHPVLRAFALNIKAPAEATPGAQPAPAQAIADPFKALGSILDANNDKQLQAAEVRQAVQTTVQAFYSTADTNRDGQLNPTEVNAAIVGMVNTAGQAAFQLADTDNNGQISQAEYDKAIIEPARLVFRTIDANNDGQISPQEAQAARTLVMSQLRNLRVPEPANSAANLIKSGAKPEQVAPVPTFAAPAAAQPAAPPQQ